MEKELLRKVQLAQLEIANEIKRVCDENNIQYFLTAGSLLGAVRHQGFIPWDDDMDFGMLWTEYEKFLQIAPEKLGDQFILQSWDTDDGYPFVFAKVLKLGTEFVEDVFQNGKKRNELYVDIFAYYPYPVDEKLQKKQGQYIQFYKHVLMVQSGMTPWTRPKSLLQKIKVIAMYSPFILAAKIMDREKLKEKYTECLKMTIGKEMERFFPAGTSKFGKITIPKECFDSYTVLPFEDTTFSAMEGYIPYLKIVYGDYMKLPPEDQRENHHKIIRVSL